MKVLDLSDPVLGSRATSIPMVLREATLLLYASCRPLMGTQLEQQIKTLDDAQDTKYSEMMGKANSMLFGSVQESGNFKRSEEVADKVW